MDPWAAFGSDDDDSQGGGGGGGEGGSDAGPNNDPDVEDSECRTWHESLARCIAGSVLGRLPVVSSHTPRARLRVGCVVVVEPRDGGEPAPPPSLSLTLLRQLLKLQGIGMSDVGATSIDAAELEDADPPACWDALLVVIGTTPVGSPAVDEAGHRQSQQSSLERCLVSTVNGVGQCLVPGGAIMYVCQSKQDSDRLEELLSLVDDDVWEHSRHSFGTTTGPGGSSDGTIVSLTKRLGRIQHETCPWLSRTPHQLEEERARVREATVPVSAHEAQSHQLNEASILLGVEALRSFGYCIVPRLLRPDFCVSLGTLALEDLHDAARILQRDHGVDLYHPGGDSSKTSKEAGTYRELSLREDFRMDVRNGPRLDRIRSWPEHTYRPNSNAPGVDGNEAWVIRAETPLHAKDGASTPFFRGHPDLLEIARRCMNPPIPSALDVSGNWGRFNFHSSRPGTYQDVRVGRVGAIVSLPGAADQALHADTPHLFEIGTHLPPHYVNAFCPGAPSAPGVGQTALVHGSHRLAAASKMLAPGGNNAWHAAVVRPRLEPGDVLLFDCRILHFGLANAAGSSVERPILYANMTLAWFHDPKNWDDQQRIFPTNPGKPSSLTWTRRRSAF